ncbi:MAG TPA: MFS transporter [Alphaproteobacteria bacterium]|nr:MFS transporter [Alphaproteobacteria bacterium]
MVSLLMSVAALLLGVAIINTGNGMFSTFLSLRMNLEGFPPEVTGLVMSAYYAGMAVGARTCDRLINRVGHVRAFAAFAAVVSAIVLISAFFVSPYVWGVMRATLGFCFAGLFMVVESWLNARASVGTRGRLLSLYMMVSYLALGTGQLLLDLRDPHSRDFFLLAALFYSLSLVPLVLTSAETPGLLQSSTLRLRALYDISPLGVLACLSSGLVTSSLYGMGAIFAQNSGFDLSEVSYFMGAAVLGGLALQYPIGRLSDRYDRRYVILAVALATAATALLITALAGHAKAAMIALVCLYGGFSFTLYPLGVAHANDFVDPKDAVKASGGLLLSWGLGASWGPIAAAAMMGRLGPRGLFIFVVVVTVLLAFFTVWRMTRRPTVPLDKKEPFAPPLGVTPIGEEAARAEITGRAAEMERAASAR